MSQFKVYYYEESKPNGKRSFTAINNNYEDILFTAVLNDIHKRATKGYDYDWPFLNQSVFVQRKNMNTLICEYEVQIHDVFNSGEIKGNYKIEIECLTPPNNKKGEDILFKSNREIDKIYETSKPKKSKHLTSWLSNESRRIKWFILDLHEKGSLQQLKNNMTKSTYYQNLKICKEKGYIKNGKLVKRVYVSKIDS